MTEKSSVARPVLGGQPKAAAPARIVVLGSSGHAHATCVEWNAASLPNLVDYDICIVNVRSLSDAIISKTKDERFKEMRRMLTRLLVSDGKIIILSDRFHSVKKPKSFPEENDNYDWAPIWFSTTEESGDTKEIIENRFPKYFSKFKHWGYFFRTPRLSNEFKDYFGSGGSFKFEVPGSPLIRNRENRWLAAACRVRVTEKDTDKQKEFGEIVLLPLLADVDERESVNLVLDDLTGLPQLAAPPSWIEQVSVPATKGIEKELDNARNNIKHWAAEEEKLKRQKAAFDEYKKLLYASGAELEQIFRQCLDRLGCPVTSAKHGQEEYIATYKGEDHLVEVKGVSKSAALDHVRQLIDYILIYQQETGKECHGILFVNAWKSLPPAERGTSDRPIFPADVIKRAAANNISLISSVDFFNAFCKFLDDPSLAAKILELMMTGQGVTDLASASKG